MDTEPIGEIVDYWLGSALDGPEATVGRRDWWYRGGPAVDAEIEARFGELVAKAITGEFAHWPATADGALAMILLLDQFTRNLYRNTPEAYAGDARAFQIVNATIEKGLDRMLHPVSRIWLYHPFHHAESVREQDHGIALLHTVHAAAPDAWKPVVERSIEGWGRHRDIVARFGRFPHRNDVLGRESTAEEIAYLADGAETFGQGPKAAG